MKDFSARLEQLRGNQTQRAFARRLGVPLNTYTNWVRKINEPRSEQITKICTECNVSAEWLLGASETLKAPKTVLHNFEVKEENAEYESNKPCRGCVAKDAEIARLNHHLDVLMRELEARLNQK